jgi:hypothetical protein
LSPRLSSLYHHFIQPAKYLLIVQRYALIHFPLFNSRQPQRLTMPSRALSPLRNADFMSSVIRVFSVSVQTVIEHSPQINTNVFGEPVASQGVSYAV